MASYTISFTERSINSALKKHSPPLTLRDEQIKGLSLIITNTRKAYYLDKKINGKVYHRKIDDFLNISPSNARERTSKLIAKLREGVDPRAIRKQEKAKYFILKITIQEIMDDFEDSSPALSTGTLKGYKRAIKLTFKDIKNRPLFSTTSEIINKLHFERSKKTKSKADHDMRVFRLLWNWAVNKYKKDCPEILNKPNPVSEALNSSHRAGTKGWNKVPRKQSIIPRKKLTEWFAELHHQLIIPSKSKTRESTIYLTELLILTGLRFNEAASLTWSKVDFVKETLIIDDQTGKNRQELIKPITNRVKKILQHQQDKHRIYIFPGLKDYIRDTRDFRAKMIEASGIEFSNHDLRRVYLSAGSRAGVSSDILKRLVNHLPKTQDVTAGYIIQSLDELQEYAQQIEDQILIDAGIKKPPIDNTLINLLNGMSEEDKRKIIVQLSDELTREVTK